jgi:hypothetical protein
MVRRKKQEMAGWRGDAAEAKIAVEEVSGPSREEGLKERAQRGKESRNLDDHFNAAGEKRRVRIHPVCCL